MKNLISFITLIAFLGYVSPTNAAENDGIIYPIKLNEISPFEGLLLSPIAVASLLTDKKFNEDRCNLLVNKCEEKSKIDLKAQKDLLDLNLEKVVAKSEKEKTVLEEKTKILESEIKKKDQIIQQQASNQNNVSYYAAGGFVVGILTIFAASKIFN